MKRELDPYTLLCVSRYHARQSRACRRIRDQSNRASHLWVRMTESSLVHALSASHWKAKARALTKTTKPARKR